MEKNLNQTERRPYVKPEANLFALRVNENIAYSGDEFNGEDDDFDNA
jgi:hypothetical protein